MSMARIRRLEAEREADKPGERFVLPATEEGRHAWFLSPEMLPGLLEFFAEAFGPGDERASEAYVSRLTYRQLLDLYGLAAQTSTDNALKNGELDHLMEMGVDGMIRLMKLHNIDPEAALAEEAEIKRRYEASKRAEAQPCQP
jgi:hypothetical protein